MALTLRTRQAADEARFGWNDYVQWLTSGPYRFPMNAGTTYTGSRTETIDEDFEAYASLAKSHGVIAACLGIRASVFAEVRFRYQQFLGGQPANLFGDATLDILERPWPNGSTGELAARMIQDADLGGQFYAVRANGRLYRRRPDKMVIVLSGNPAEDEFVEPVGYTYYPGGIQAGGRFYTYSVDEVVHWSPNPDPLAEYKGMSWITPVLREVRTDRAATQYKQDYFDNAASPNMVVTTPESVMTQEQFDDFVERLRREHAGPGNRHKQLFLAPGADVEVIGANLADLDLSNSVGRDEARIASAAGVPPVLIGLKESMQGSSLNAGNYGQARRRFADGTMMPLYRSAAAALEKIVQVPSGARLWYDAQQVAFFREDRKDAAEIQQVKAVSIRQLVDAGYDPPSVVDAVNSEDMSRLAHSGLYSVQLQAPGTETQEPARTVTFRRDEHGMVAEAVVE